MSQHTLSSGQVYIGGDESAGLWVVVAGPQVVPLGLLVVNVAPVAEGVQRSQCSCQGAGAAELLAPAVICVFYYGIPAPVNQLDNVPLTVAQVVVICPVVIDRLDQASGVIGEQQVCCPCCQSHQHRVVVEVVGRRSAHGLRGPKAVHVVGVAGRAGDARQLLPVPGQGLSPVAGGIPHGVVGDGLAVIAGQLVLPRAGRIDVRDRGSGRARVRGRGVGVDLLLGNVPPGIVGIGHRLVGEAIVLPDQLVCAVVLVGYGSASPGDRGYVPAVVVGVGVGRVAVVLVCEQRSYLRVET